MKKKYKDANQLAKSIVDIATGSEEKQVIDSDKNSAAVQLEKLGGKVRAASLSPEQRRAIAKKAAAKRWETKKK